MMTWIRQRTLPLLPEVVISPRVQRSFEAPRSTISFAAGSQRFCSVRRVEAAGAIASLERSSDRSSESQMKKTFVFAYLDGNEWEQYIQEFGLETSNVPCAIVMSERVGKRSPFQRRRESTTVPFLSIVT